MVDTPGRGLCVRGLCVEVTAEDGSPVRVVDRVDLAVAPGECLGIVGESGSGKTMTALALAGLVGHMGGNVHGQQMELDGRDLLGLREREWVQVRGRDIGFMFQQPSRSLHPSFTVGHQIAEAVRSSRRLSRRAAMAEAVDLLDRVGIREPARRSRQYPHEFSGGMAQRAMLAIALAGEPSLLIADEPTSALDVTIQAQILELLDAIRKASNISIIVITHDIGVVSALSQQVAVMYAGQVVEQGPTAALLRRPIHPYTKGLMAAIPKLGEALPPPIDGMVPPPSEWTGGCRFRGRCPHYLAGVCDADDEPLDHELAAHGVRCARRVDVAALVGARP